MFLLLELLVSLWLGVLLFAVTFGFLLIVLYVLILFIVYSVIVIVACLLCIVTLDSFSRMVFLFGAGFVVVIVLVFGVW